MSDKKSRGSRRSSSRPFIDGNSVSAQRQRVLEALRDVPGGLTTIELREQLDVLMPAARIHELRWMFGHNIMTTWALDENAQGRRHRVAHYVLQPGEWQGAAA